VLPCQTGKESALTGPSASHGFLNQGTTNPNAGSAVCLVLIKSGSRRTKGEEVGGCVGCPWARPCQSPVPDCRATLIIGFDAQGSERPYRRPQRTFILTIIFSSQIRSGTPSCVFNYRNNNCNNIDCNLKDIYDHYIWDELFRFMPVKEPM
jgi:hypothetical protein